jgi:ABC-type glutathione transport system ATPase component
MSLILDIDHVGKTFLQGGLLSRRSVEAVKDISLQIEAGKPEILSVVGESGSGKSTLAAMVLGQQLPTRGRVLFDGVDVASIRSSTARRAFMAKVQPVLQSAETGRSLPVRHRRQLHGGEGQADTPGDRSARRPVPGRGGVDAGRGSRTLSA